MANAVNKVPPPEISVEKAAGLLCQELISRDESLKVAYFQANRVNKGDVFSSLISVFASEEIDIARAAAEAVVRRSDANGNGSISQNEYDSAFSIVDKEYVAIRKYLSDPSCQDPSFTPGVTLNLLGSDTARDCLKKYLREATPAKSK